LIYSQACNKGNSNNNEYNYMGKKTEGINT
jgi:hypothetical protein